MNEPIQPASETLNNSMKNPPARMQHAALSGWHDYFRVYIDSFAKYGALSRHMLCAITGHTQSTARTALHDMARVGLVQFHRTGGEFMYYLTTQGIALSEYSRFAKSAKSAFGTVRHDMTVNRIMTNAILQSNPPTHGILRWLGPAGAKEELADYYGFEQTARSETLNYIPDGYVEFFQSEPFPQIYRAVLEIDMGTEMNNRVLHKMELGVRTLAAKRDGAKFNLLWVFVDHNVRCQHLTELMRERYQALQREMARVPRLLVVAVKANDLDALVLPHHAKGINWAGAKTEPPNLTDFVGVSRVYDKINQQKVLRTQIPALQ